MIEAACMRRALVGVLTAIALPMSSAAAELVTSPNDPRQYEAFVLPNGMKVLLVSDPEADKAAASMDVLVGSSADPQGREGLAHFLEHMLFLGNEKYPSVGEYQQFIAGHGGRTNAYTAFENTNYFFDIDPEHLEPALDRFAQFFIAPLFSPDYVVQERNIVHSEYETQRREDGWRLLHVIKQVVNPEHPFSNFNVGSVDTLADREGSDIRDEMIAFYREHYSAGLMSMAVAGPQPLSVLRGWVEERFAEVVDTGAQRQPIDVPLFAADALPARVDAQPMREARTLTLRFPVPAVREHYAEDPLGYVGHLLGHEGPGSLLSALRAQGWAESVAAGMGVSNFDHGAFDVRVQLTESGLDRIESIVALVFDQIERVRESGVDEERFAELQQVSELAFRFQEPIPPLRYVSALARNMQIYPLRDAIRGPYAMDRFAPELISEYLDYLRPDNLLLTVVAPEVDTDRVEPWFGVPFRVAAIDPAAVASWALPDDAAAQLRLPEPNPFLPQDLTIKPAPASTSAQTSVPTAVVDEPGLTLWFQQDTEFNVPRSNLRVSVRSPIATRTARDAVLADLYVAMVNDELSEFAYPARLAGLDYRVTTHSRGLTVRISGYNDGQDRFADKVLNVLRRPSLDGTRFESQRSEMRRELANADRRVPHRQLTSALQRLLLVPSWSEAERLAVVDDIDLDSLRRFVDDFWAETELVGLAHGNLVDEDALIFANLVHGTLRDGSKPVMVERAGVVDVADGRRRIRDLDIEHHDSALAVYVQGGGSDFSSRATFLMLGQILGPRFFRDLRTEQQVGYVVYATYMPMLEVPGLLFVAQSSIADPGEIETRTSEFIGQQLEQLAAMDESEFEQFRSAALVRILERDTRLSERTDHYWIEIDRDNAQFDSRMRLADAVRALDRRDVIETYRRAVAERDGGWMLVRSLGSEHADTFSETADAATEYIRDPVTFQSRRTVISTLDLSSEDKRDCAAFAADVNADCGIEP